MEKLKALLDGNKDKLNAWFYDATDAELLESIKFLCSKEITDKYPKEFLSEYIKYCRDLLKGEQRDFLSNLDTERTLDINFASGNYHMTEILESLVNKKYQRFFSLCKLIIISSPMYFKDLLKFQTKRHSKSFINVTRPINCFCRTLNSKLLFEIKFSFDCIRKTESLRLLNKKFMTKTQKKKIMMRCVREMIRKGRINLEQRAF